MASSSEWVRPKTTYVSISTVYSDVPLTVDLDINSPKFLCLSANNTTINVNLPIVNSFDAGLIYEFKNIFTGGGHIIHINSNSVLLHTLTNYAKLVFSGDQWIIINVA